VPQKRSLEAAIICDLFRAENPACRDITWVQIKDMSEVEVAHVLGESAWFLSLCRLEAVGLLALEALASGWLVAGFTGFGGRDYMTARNGFWAAEDDCVEATELLTRAVRLPAEDSSHHLRMMEEGALTAAHYNRARFQERLVACWRAILDQETPAPSIQVT